MLLESLTIPLSITQTTFVRGWSKFQDRMLYCLINASLWISWTLGFETIKVIDFVGLQCINRAKFK